ncbi:hypothetical protein JCM5296_004305 [Sporobolomyces johnsonii]
MVWIVSGTLHNDPDDQPDQLPPVSSHYLRPCRLYRTGRAGGVRAPPKPGQTKQGPASRDRPYDFKIKSLGISKEGAWEMTTGGDDWQPIDDPTSPTNSDPYPLTLTLHKRFNLERADGETQELVPTQEEGATQKIRSIDVKSGDQFVDPQKGYKLTFNWKPIVLSYPGARAEMKNELELEAKKLGIKISFQKALAHHTHYLLKSIIPSSNLCVAAMQCLRIVSPAYFTELQLRGHVPDRPPASELPVHPGPPPPSSSSKEELAAYDKQLSTYEKELLRLEPDVGGDPDRWWGHSALEKNWDAAWPNEDDYPAQKDKRYPGYEAEGWDRKEARKRLFEGVLVVSFREDDTANAVDAELVRLGAGHFFAFDVLQRATLPSVTDVISAISQFKDQNGITDGSKVVLMAPAGISSEEGETQTQGREMDEEARGRRELLRELQRALKVGKLCDASGRDIVQAIYDVDTSGLFAPEEGSHRLAQTASHPSQPTQATPPFPTGGVPGTHPESGQIAAGARYANAEAGPSGTAGQQEAAPTQPRKLTRRAKTARPNAVSRMFADDDDDDVGTSRSSRPVTQEYGRAPGPSYAQPESSGMDLDTPDAPSPAQPPRPTGRTLTLPRRAGQRRPHLLLDSDVEDSTTTPGGSGTQSEHQDWVRNRIPREERMKRIQEADDAEVAREREKSQSLGTGGAGAKGKGKGKAREEEEEEDGSGPRSSRKRGKSQALGSGSEDEVGSRQPKKRTSKKDGAAPVSTTNKRTVDAVAAASSEADEPPVTAKKPKTSTATAPPKNKKELAAQKKAEKEASAREAATLLQIKTSRRKGAEEEQALNAEFNALKIVKPVLKAMPHREKRRMEWGDEDSDVERERAIQADQERREGEDDDDDDEMDPTKWRKVTQAMFVVKTLDFERKERRPPRNDVDLPEQWAGRPNFKRFRPKNSKTPRLPLADRPRVELALPEAVDYGLGPGYQDKRGFSQLRHVEDEEEDDEMLDAMTVNKGQTKLTFASKTTKAKAKAAPKKATVSKAKSKGKAKQVVLDSEDESDRDSSNTLKPDDMDVDELDYSDEFGGGGASSSKASTAKKATNVAPAKRAPRRAAPQTILIDDSDSDSDSGLTFKGLGKKSGRR